MHTLLITWQYLTFPQSRAKEGDLLIYQIFLLLVLTFGFYDGQYTVTCPMNSCSLQGKQVHNSILS